MKQENFDKYINDFFSNEGKLSSLIPGFKYRKSQMEMAQEV